MKLAFYCKVVLAPHFQDDYLVGTVKRCQPHLIIIIIITLLPKEIHGNVSWRSGVTNYEPTVRPTEQTCI